MLKFALFALFLLSASAANPTPIPPTPAGFSRGSNTPTLHIEAYYDLLCPSSKAQWGILEPLLKEYELDSNQTLRFTVHIFPLPYHYYSFLMSQGAQVIYDKQTNAKEIFTYIDTVFENQEDYGCEAVVDKSQNTIRNSLYLQVIKRLPYASTYFLQGLTAGNAYDVSTRIQWKYGAYNKVTGTPTFFANGVEINGAAGFTRDDWKKFIDGGYVKYLGISQNIHPYAINL